MSVRQILLPWDSQPQDAVEIDWSHPLTRGLRLAVIGGQSRNLVDGVSASSVALISPGVGSEGRTWTADAPSAISNARGIVFPFDLSGALTVHLIVLRATSVNDADSSRVANAITNRNNSQANFWQLNLGSGFGASGDDDKPRFATAAVGVGTIYANGTALSGNNPTTVALANQTWYRITAAKASGATDSSGTNQLTLGAERAAPTDYYGLNGSIALALAWTRELSATEIAQLAGREYELFAPRSMPVPVSAGGGTTNATITSAAGAATTSTITGSATAAAALSVAAGAATANSLAGKATSVAAITPADGTATTSTLTGSSAAASAITPAAGAATGQTLVSAGSISAASMTSASGSSTTSTFAASAVAASVAVAAAGVSSAQVMAATAQAVAAITAATGVTTAATMASPAGTLSNAEMRELYEWVKELHRIHGLTSGVDLVVTPTSRTAGAISQTISEAGTTVTVTRP